MGFLDKCRALAEAEQQRKQAAAAAIVDRKNELKQQGVAYCPLCLSTSVTPIKKGFGVGKALVGNLFLGPIGLLGGAIGKNKIEMHCNKCGHKYTGGR